MVCCGAALLLPRTNPALRQEASRTGSIRAMRAIRPRGQRHQWHPHAKRGKPTRRHGVSAAV